MNNGIISGKRGMVLYIVIVTLQLFIYDNIKSKLHIVILFIFFVIERNQHLTIYDLKSYFGNIYNLNNRSHRRNIIL